jgi:response regulator RpfG family c-di-GMP phosphodiesterase
MSIGPTTTPSMIPDSLPVTDSQRAMILCINQNSDVADAIENGVSDLPVDVVRARNGMQGYWLAISKSPALIVTDLRTTNGDGGEIIESMKENPQTRDIPIIVSTSHDYPGLRRHVERMGAIDCFQEPLDVTALLDAVSNDLALPKSL